MHSVAEVLARYDTATGTIVGVAPIVRRLSDLRGSFADENAYEAALQAGDPIVYQVSSIEPGVGDGDLHFGLGCVMPGRVGPEYYQTKGHLHAWREAAEFYLGLNGSGLMLLEDEATGEARIMPLLPHHTIYVPGSTAHRTVNTGSIPLTYIGIYPAKAGHDYAAISTRNFRSVVVACNERPTLQPRARAGSPQM